MRPKKVILLVEPNEQTRSVRRFLLRNARYKVLSASNAEDALEIVKGLMPFNLDLLLTELVLPDMDGNELTRRAKQHDPEIRAVIVSANFTSYEHANTADIFLPKGSISSAELLDACRLLAHRKRGPKAGWKALAPVAAHA